MMRSSRLLAAPAALLTLLVHPLAFADEPNPNAPPAPPKAPAAGVIDDGGADEEDPARPPPAGKAVVWGVIKSNGSKQPMPDATVTVVSGKGKAVADYDGRFRLVLAPGTYELRVWGEGHKAQKIKGITVLPGKITRYDVALDQDKVVEDVVEVEVTPDRASAEVQLAMRKNSSQVADVVSAKDIAKTPDRNAADAARRVVGATVVGDKYVYVRGLGERYTNALLNGAPLPSAEPDRRAVPLDLFPTLVLSDLTIVKTFTPDVPGDFAGGSVRVNTRQLPEQLTVQGILQVGMNTQTTFQKRLSYQGSSLDWLGIDGGARKLPSEIPDYKVVRFGPKPGGGNITPEELTAYGRAINAYMSTRTTTSFPNMTGSFVVGNTFKLGNQQEIGVMAALTYGRRFSRRTGEILRTYTVDPMKPDTLLLRNDYLAETGLDQVIWGAYAAVTYKPHKNHKIAITGLHSRSSDNEARTIEGLNEERAAVIRDTRLRFLSRSLTFTQLSGAHKLPSEGLFEYNLSASLATADEPDTRETVYVRDDERKVYSWDRGTLSGSHFYGKQKERSLIAMADYTQPLDPGERGTKIKFGVLVSNKARTFDARRFRFVPRAGQNPAIFDQEPDKLFTSQNIGTALELEEYTRANDSYTAAEAIYAGYVMTDAWLGSRVRVIAGARVEASRQGIDSIDPFAADVSRIQANLNKTDILPSINLIFKTTKDSNLRATISRTVARPELRELSPFVFTDYFGAREILGNPALQRTSIYNADLRFELFPGAGEVVALSAFYKHFFDPIEQIILPSNQGVVSFQNATAARAVGVEVEARKSFDFLSPKLKDLGVLLNLTWVHSRVALDTTQVGTQTNSERPLFGQSPYVVNAGLDFASERWGTRARVVYNVFGPRLVQVGSDGLPDVYEQPRHKLDATVAQQIGKHVDLRFSAENLLDSPVRWTQGKDKSGEANVVSQFKTGVTFQLGVTVSN